METSNDKPAGCRERPACFGDFERVFFIGKYGLREVRSVCRACPCVKDCLGAAADSPTGQELRAARIQTIRKPGQSKIVGFLDRWSQLKSMRKPGKNTDGEDGK